MTKIFSSRDRQNQTLRNLMGVLCLLLVLFAGTAQAVHAHSVNEAANPGCSLCAVAHVTALTAPVPAAPVAVEVVTAVFETEAVAVAKRFFSFSLYVRPPPAVLTAHA